MGNMRLFWRFISDDADTVTASTASANYPVSNVLTSSLDQKWISQDDSSGIESIVFDLGSNPSAVNGIAILNHDLLSTDSNIKIEGNDVDSWGSPSFTQALSWSTENIIFYFAANQTYRYWRFQVQKADTDTRSIGRLIVGRAYTMVKNYAKDTLSYGGIDTSEIEVTRDGNVYADVGSTLETLTCTFVAATAADRTEIRALHDELGTHKPFVTSVDPETDSTDFIYGRLVAIPTMTIIALNRWTIVYGVQEAR